MTAKPRELRDYQEAVLRALEDGLPHHRDELLRTGIAAIDPQYALAMYQKKHKANADARFEGLDNDERFAEIERQRYEGGKLQVTKFLSHMETRLLAEVVSFGPPQRPGATPRRMEFRITERGLARLQGASDEEIDKNWVQEARDALLIVAQTHNEFTTEDIWNVPLAKPIRDGGQHSPLETIFSWGARQGLCSITERTRPHSQDAGRPMRIWESLVCGKDPEQIDWVTCNICGTSVDPMQPGTSRVVICNQEIPRPGEAREGARPFAPEPTGDHTCVECSKNLRSSSRRVVPNIRQRLIDARKTRV